MVVHFLSSLREIRKFKLNNQITKEAAYLGAKGGICGGFWELATAHFIGETFGQDDTGNEMKVRGCRGEIGTMEKQKGDVRVTCWRRYNVVIGYNDNLYDHMTILEIYNILSKG